MAPHDVTAVRFGEGTMILTDREHLLLFSKANVINRFQIAYVQDTEQQPGKTVLDRLLATRVILYVLMAICKTNQKEQIL